jgi:acetyl esterase/lipase
MNIQILLLRRTLARIDAKRDKGLSIPEDVEYFSSLPYGAGLTLDVCCPKGTIGKLPTIVSFHGGGYVYGDAKLYSLYAASLAERGFTVVNFNYRLAPDFKFPTPLTDASDVMRWMCANEDEYHIDTSNAFFVGDSAGAQLASQYAAICSNREYADIMELAQPDIKLRAIALNCGMYDLQRTAAAGGLMEFYFTKNPAQFGKKLDVLNYIDLNYPPTFVMSAHGDFLCDECEPMGALLRSRGVETISVIYGDKSTGHVFHCDMRSEVGRKANDDEAKFFMRHVR